MVYAWKDVFVFLGEHEKGSADDEFGENWTLDFYPTREDCECLKNKGDYITLKGHESIIDVTELGDDMVTIPQFAIFPCCINGGNDPSNYKYMIFKTSSQLLKRRWIEKLTSCMNHVKRSRWTLESEPFGQILMAHADYWGGGGGVERQGMTGGVDPNFLLINLHNGNGFIGVKNPWVWFCAEGGHGNDL